MVRVAWISPVVLFLAISLLPALAEEESSRLTQDRATSGYASQGQLFLDGVHVAPPYHVAVTENTVLINGRLFSGKLDEVMFDREDYWPGMRDRDFDEGGFGRRRFGRMQLAGRMQPQERQPTSAKIANVLLDNLNNDYILVAFSGKSTTVLDMNGAKATFCNALLAPENTPENEQSFVRLAREHADQDLWTSMLHNLQPSQELQRWMQRTAQDYTNIEVANVRQIAAANRLQNASYPLTLVGMLLGVFALGHTLKWSANHDSATEAVRFLKTGLLLIVAMSALDLIWTILTSQAGQMREINPFALKVIDSPLQLIAFKLVATLGACGILFALRSSPRVQVATWWMCLVCVLMTFRWVVFNSLMS